ncbi:hypothetical protein [Kribbella sp. C-35]|uniref:hypothetical protein n=1 Tax=Kribbella sp. C-35 TaxID=2789276 RepID=UPI00397A6A21
MAGVTGLAVVGVVSSLVFISLTINLTVLAIAASMYGSIQVHIGLVQGLKPLALIGSVLDGALRVGLLVLAACGYVATVGGSTFLLLLVIIGTSPPAVHYLSDSTPDRGEAPGARATREGEEDAVPVPKRRKDPADLSVEELCLAWRSSFTELSKSRTDKDRLAVVSVRDGVLGELERRDPAAFAEWLDSGPRAAGNPAPYFTHQAGHHGQLD